MPKLLIGTSGFSYPHWEDGVFYPQDLPRAKQLEFYAEHFNTVELNSSFYHLPSPKAFTGWYQRTPQDFLFAVKASRYITHIKRLKDSQEPWERFINNAKNLKKKLGPILFQLPPKWKANKERLSDFLKILPGKYKYVFEFRDQSWFSGEIYKLLENRTLLFVLLIRPWDVVPKGLYIQDGRK